MNADRIKLTALMLLCATGLGLAFNGEVIAANAGAGQSGEATRFARVFSDHMVLQRKLPIRIWGRAQAQTELTVTLAGESINGQSKNIESINIRAATDGNWQVDLAAMTAGGPYTLSLHDAAGVVQTISDVLIGDVWLCSGQSNMEVAVGEVNQSHAAPPRTPGTIRYMTIAQDSQVTPQSDFETTPGWSVADAGTIPDFSAVCYLLGYELQKTHDIPVGLIKAAWGGSGIKPWISARALKRAGGYDQRLAWLQTYVTDQDQANAQFGDAWENWWRQEDAASGEPWKEPADETSGWTASPAIMGNWKLYGDPALANHLGMVWFRKSFDLSAEQAAQDAVLALGGIDEVDYLWINGHFIGSTFGYGTERFYEVPGGTFQAGSNTITVNVLNTWDAGGMIGPNDHVALKLADEQTIALGDGWLYRKVPAGVSDWPRTPWEPLGGLAGLFNAMIAPLEGLSLTGAIWYQGETDAGNPAPYEQLLTALTTDWRERFGASLPFLIVQLPNFGTLPTAPVESGWAAIRDAQRRVASAHPDTGLVVTVDVGDRAELHPRDKRILARRAADVARVLVLGEQGIPDGLSPAAVFRQRDTVVLEFDPSIDTLVVVSAAAPIAFELCGDTQGDCVFAESRIEGNRVVLTAPGFKHATRVRHCWADAPVCNLYGASGLPVSSFEVQIAAGNHEKP